MVAINLTRARQKLKKVSNFSEVKRRAKEIFGEDAVVKINLDNKHKYKFSKPSAGVIDRPFGDIHYADFTKHKDEKRRRNYLARSRKIKGDWKKDKYSKNNLAIKLLW